MAAEVETMFFVREKPWHNILPEPDGSEAAGNFINRYFSESKEELSIALKDDVSEKLRRRQELEEQIGVLGKEKQKIEQEVKLYLGEAESACINRRKGLIIRS